MFQARLRILRVFGIPIEIDVSWIIILLLLTWTLSSFYAQQIEGLEQSAYWGMGLLTSLAFFLCIVLHELGHALVAKQMGIPIRSITLFIFGGVAELEGEPSSAMGELWMALAGPAVSTVLAIIFWSLSFAGTFNDWLPSLILLFTLLAWINTAVLIFNLLPAFPLDGGRVLRAILWAVSGRIRWATYWATISGRLFAWFLIFVGVFQIVGGNFIGGIWLGLIGLFLSNAAQSGYQQVLVRQLLQREPVARFMTESPISVPPWLTLREWVDAYVYRYHYKGFPVVAEDGTLLGLITTDQLAEIPRDEWSQVRVRDVMLTDLDKISISPHANAYSALEKMKRVGLGRLLVVEGAELVGMVSLRDLLRMLQLKLELEPEAHEEAESPEEVSAR